MKISQDLFLSLYKSTEEELSQKYELLGEGVSRKVYALNSEYVLKYAKGAEGVYQNNIEYHVYTHVNTHLKKYLCPIACFKPEMLIMRRASPLSTIVKDKFININTIRKEKTIFKDLNLLADKFYLYYEDIISSSSWGKLDDCNVLIDYGCTTSDGDIYYDFLFLFS